jgi:PAS domain S-box-containing protein
LAAVIAGLLFGAAWFELGRWRERQRLQDLQADVRIALVARSNALVSALERRLALLDGLLAFVELELGSDRFTREFPEFASHLRGAVPGVRNLAVARGSVYVAVSPVEGSERILDYDPMTDPRPEVRADARRALDGRGAVVSGPIDLVQGGLGLIARRAIYRDKAVWGLVAVVLDLTPILEESGLHPPPGGLLVAVRSRGGRAFSGLDKTFSGQPVIQQFDVPGGQWEIAGQMPGGWQTQLAGERRLWAASGLVLGLIPVTLVFLVAWRQSIRRQYQARTEALVEQRTAELARTTLIVENSPVVLAHWLPGDDRAVEHVSDNIAQFGYSAADFHSGRLKWADIVLPEDRDRMRAEAGAFSKAGLRQTRQEYRIVTADGRTRWMEDRTSIIEGAGARPILQGIVIDITERKQRDEAQREADRQLREILEGGQFVALMMDTSGRVTFGNRYLFDLTGWSREEVIGQEWFGHFVPEPARQAARRWFDAAMRTGVLGAGGENPILTREGTTRDLFWDNTLIRDSSGTATGIASFGRDVTEQRQLEAQYRQSQKMEAVGQLAGGIAHDFNNLLQVISGYANLALDGLPDGAPLSAEVSEIRRAAERATGLVRQLLAFSRRQTMERRAIDLNETVGDLLKLLRRIIGEHIDLEFIAGAEVPAVQADPGQIEQVLVNLCVNARDAMPDGGRIAISTARVAVGLEFVERHPWARVGDFVLLAVSDTGPGIPADILDHIFEPFFTTKDVGKGTGLGLATVYGIVKQHEGMIEVQTGQGGGASFRIYLPAVTSGMTAEEPRVADVPARQAHETILIAEDEELVRNLARRVLEQGGYRVLVARDGAEAISLVESSGAEIDLALLDVVMPKAGGPQVRARIRELQPGMAVMYCTGYSRQMLTDSTGVDEESLALLLKPYSPRSLLDRVRDVLAARGPGGAAGPIA